MATKRKYNRELVEQPKPEDWEIRINTRTEATKFVRRAIWLLKGAKGDEKAQPYDTIRLTAIDNAIPKALVIAEVVRRRVPDLHQINTIGNIDIVERYVPKEEGLLEVRLTRTLASLHLVITRKPTEAELANPGYLPPLPASEVQEKRERQPQRRNNRERSEDRDRGSERGGESNRARSTDRSRTDTRRDDRRDNRRDDPRDNRRDDRRDDRRNDDRRDDRRTDDRRDNRRDDRRDNNRRDDRRDDRDRGTQSRQTRGGRRD